MERGEGQPQEETVRGTDIKGHKDKIKIKENYLFSDPYDNKSSCTLK
jgi:hypothetical protein